MNYWHRLQAVAAIAFCIAVLVGSSACGGGIGSGTGTGTGSGSGSGSGSGTGSGTGTGGAGFSDPNNKVADTNAGLSSPVIGDSFTLTAPSTRLTVRFVSYYAAQAALLTSDQIAPFQNNQAFSGFALSDGTCGRSDLNLGPGTYTIGIRTKGVTGNRGHMEVDTDPGVVTGFNFAGAFMSFNQVVPAGTYTYQLVNLDSTSTYYSESCNPGNCDVWVMATSQFSSYINGQQFTYYPPGGQDEPDLPYGVLSGSSARIPAGSYYIVWNNKSTDNSFVVAYGETWSPIYSSIPGAKQQLLRMPILHPAMGSPGRGIPATPIPELPVTPDLAVPHMASAISAEKVH